MQLTGKIIAITGLESGSDKLIIHTDNDTIITQYHDQDCCESVYIAQVDQDPNKYIGAEIYELDERTIRKGLDNITHPDPDIDYEPESWTATFYTLKTSKGYLDWRWQGESNGYYSESVTTDISYAEDRI